MSKNMIYALFIGLSFWFVLGVFFFLRDRNIKAPKGYIVKEDFVNDTLIFSLERISDLEIKDQDSLNVNFFDSYSEDIEPMGKHTGSGLQNVPVERETYEQTGSHNIYIGHEAGKNH